MEKYEIKVPEGIKYISEWGEYQLPGGHIIVDKGVTGCGYTEYCLMNRQNVILCSPRKLLLENKRDQHKTDLNILYLENKIQDFQGVQGINSMISSHLLRCQEENEAVKFMVTYDSLHYLVDYLRENRLLEMFHFIIDEFQIIFLDSYFKSDVELDFVQVLQGCPNVLYLSATPMLEKYLDKLPEFQKLPYQVLDWSETGYVETARILRRRTNSLAYECGQIIDEYLSGKYKSSISPFGVSVESKEAIFYLNSVSEILRIVKSRKLTPENTRIICADTPENKVKLEKLGFEIGKIPLEGEENPMFMFCTSTVYIGVDFYSDNARTFIFADPNIRSLGMDISMDLPQIIGRLRKRENPFKNEVTIFHKTQKNKVSREDFERLQEERKKETDRLLSLFQKGSEEEKTSYIKKLKDGIQLRQYSNDFVAISERTNLPVYNYLVEIANQRAYEVSQEDYQDNISVTKALAEIGSHVEDYLTEAEEYVKDFLEGFFSTGIFTEKLEMYCDFRDSFPGDLEIQTVLGYKIKDPRYSQYYEYFGSSRCRAVGYKEADLQRELRNDSRGDQLREVIYQTFKPGDRYSSFDLKKLLDGIYKNLGISKTPKATDLAEYFKMTKTKITLSDKSVVNGFKLGEKL